jgi:hypothetical protein
MLTQLNRPSYISEFQNHPEHRNNVTQGFHFINNTNKNNTKSNNNKASHWVFAMIQELC